MNFYFFTLGGTGSIESESRTKYFFNECGTGSITNTISKKEDNYEEQKF